MAIHVMHVVHGVEKEQTGAGYCVPSLCRALAQKGIEVTLAALDLGGEVIDLIDQTGSLEFRRFPYTGPRKIGYSPKLRSFINAVLHRIDIIQAHFLWSYPEALASWMALKNKKPLVKMPHGALFPEALSKSALAKSIWFKFIDGPALRNAQCIIATSQNEASCITREFHPKRLEIIPHGIDLPNLPERNIAMQRAREILNSGDKKYALYLGNLNPHKNLERLIGIWRQIQKSWSKHVLLLVGPGRAGYVRGLQQLIQHLGMGEQIKLFGPMHGPDKWALLNAAETLVLPSKSENFGLVVAEALYCGTPAVASRGSPWSSLETEGFGHWVDTENGGFADAIQDVLSWTTEKRKQMSLRARTFIENNFTWDKVADQYIRLYQDLFQ